MEASTRPAFVPAVAAFRERVEASFARQGAMATPSARRCAVEPGYCPIEIAPRPSIAQQHGCVHLERGGRRTLCALMHQALMTMYGKAEAPAGPAAA